MQTIADKYRIPESGISGAEMEALKSVADRQFDAQISTAPEKSTADLAREVVRKCLKNASELLDDKIKYMGDNASLVRNLLEAANEAQQLVPPDRFVLRDPFPHPDHDKKAIADAVCDVLKEQAENAPTELSYD